MDHGHIIGDTLLHAVSSGSFQDHENRFDEPTRTDGFTKLINEPTSRARTIPPPAVRSRANDVRCVDEKHCV